jgi:hypothetical protein
VKKVIPVLQEQLESKVYKVILVKLVLLVPPENRVSKV